MSFMRAVIVDENICEGCGTCYEKFSCPAIMRQPNGQARIQDDLCNGNGSCMQVCPVGAIIRPDKNDTSIDILRKYRARRSETELKPEKCEDAG